MQVHYYLSPAGPRPFDLPAIEKRLASLPGAFRLNEPGQLTYVVTASKAMARYIAAKLQMDPRTSLISQGVVTLSPTSIDVYQDAPPAVLSQMEEFITWLLRGTPCLVLSDEGEDWTERYAGNPRALFEEEEQWL